MKEKLQQEMQDVIKTTKAERERLIKERTNLSKAELEITKTIISANKNIVSAAIVAKSLIGDYNESKDK